MGLVLVPGPPFRATGDVSRAVVGRSTLMGGATVVEGSHGEYRQYYR